VLIVLRQVGELRQIEEALRSLKAKLENIQRFLPRPTRKRGLLNIGGTILKSLFGTATVVDLQSVHETFRVLHPIVLDIKLSTEWLTQRWFLISTVGDQQSATCFDIQCR
jgi:hypothetical protein